MAIENKRNSIIPFKQRSVVMILASSIDNTIGVNNMLPWDCKTDMRFFKRATTSNIVIMGWNTFESMNCKPLPNRMNIVITSKTEVVSKDDNVVFVLSKRDALAYARAFDLSDFERNTVDEHIFIIGGVQLYISTIKDVDEVLHSKIDAQYCGLHYGSKFINQALDENFTSNPKITNEIVYYNENALDFGDKDQLIEITHMYRNDAVILEFKQD